MITDATTFSFARERFIDFYEEAIPLLMAHKEEVAHYKDIELKVNVGAYLAKDEAGTLRVYTVRTGGTLIGYCVFFLGRNLHYSDSLQAIQDVLFVSRPYRKGRVGYKLLRYTEAELKREGVQVVLHHVKTTNEVGTLLSRIGYELVDLIYARRLD